MAIILTSLRRQRPRKSNRSSSKNGKMNGTLSDAIIPNLEM